MRRQRTISKVVSLDGFGFWMGQDVRLEFRPAPEDQGIRFIRTDLPDEPPIPARLEYRINRPRQTSLRNGQAQVDMIEHVMAALKGLRIDNCDIAINGSEMPGFDGSSRPFFQLLREAEPLEQIRNQPVRIIEFEKTFDFDHGVIEVSPALNEESVYGYSLRYDPMEDGSDHPIGTQDFCVELNEHSFEKEVMPCRTFLLFSEAEYLLAKGLCQRVSAQDVLVFDERGPIKNSLHFDNECARHKTLDMIGDFALSGCDWIGRIHGTRTGHHQNASAVEELCRHTVLKR